MQPGTTLVTPAANINATGSDKLATFFVEEGPGPVYTLKLKVNGTVRTFDQVTGKFI